MYEENDNKNIPIKGKHKTMLNMCLKFVIIKFICYLHFIGLEPITNRLEVYCSIPIELKMYFINKNIIDLFYGKLRIA